MTTLIIRVSDADGTTYELNRVATGLATVFARASRAAKLLGLIGDPDRWTGGRVSVHAHDGSPRPAIVYVWRVRVPAGKAVSRV